MYLDEESLKIHKCCSKITGYVLRLQQLENSKQTNTVISYLLPKYIRTAVLLLFEHSQDSWGLFPFNTLSIFSVHFHKILMK